MKNKFKKCTVKKLYLGQYTSLRDYLVQGCIEKKQGIQIHHKSWVMTLIPEQLEGLMQIHKQKFQSKYSTKKYELIDVVFTPDNLTEE